MSTAGDARREPLGSAAEWALTPQTYARLRAELDDHLSCLQADDGAEQAEAAIARLNTPAARRRLLGPHIADQVYATLHRLPTRQEWRELLWLLLWFALILCGDWLAVISGVHARDWWFGPKYFEPDNPPVLEQLLHWGAWLVLAVSRAGFYATFAVSLYRAWRLGTGVLIARLVQLKLIHTALVIVAGLIIGDVFLRTFADMGRVPYQYVSALPIWAHSASIAGIFLVASILLACFRRLRVVALGTALSALFLYPGGPIPAVRQQLETTFIRGQIIELSDGRLLSSRNAGRKSGGNIQGKEVRVVTTHDQPTPELIARYAKQYKYPQARIDPQRNTLRSWYFETMPLPWHVKNTDPDFDQGTSQWLTNQIASGASVIQAGGTKLQGPVAIPGSGLGWLAAPIPLLGLLSLGGMLLVMGRRGFLDLLLYIAVAGAALIGTVMPFAVIIERSRPLLDLSPTGFVHAPFPGFEMIMLIPFSALISVR